MKKIKNTLLAACTLTFLSACSGDGTPVTDGAYPKNPIERRRERAGKLTGEEGIVLFGGKNNNGGE